MNVVNTRISQRYDTLQNWMQRNPTLLEGELAVVATDNQTRFKIGDGQHTFNELNFIDQLKLTTVSAFANILSVNNAAVGFQNTVGTHSLAAGTDTSANGQHAIALGYKAAASSNGAFVFNGDQNYLAQPYYDHGVGTFNVNAPLSNVYIEDNDIKTALSDEGFVLSASISSKLEDIDQKIFISDAISGVAGYDKLSVVKLSANEYKQLVASDATLSNALYIVEDDYIDAYGEQIKNVAPPSDLSDAATKEYVDNALSNIQIPSDLSSFTNSPGYLVPNDISGYYKKSETSSASEISNALSSKANLSSVAHVVQYVQDSDGDYTAVTIGSRTENSLVGMDSFVNGYDCVASGEKTHAEGYQTSAIGDWSHAEGDATIASQYSAHAEGSHTNAGGDTSHTEGYYTSTDGFYTHAEGMYTYASHHASHAEGATTSALGQASHTEGGWTSTGEYAIASHAEGGFTRADGPISHVEGIKATAEISDYQSFVWQGTDVMPNELTDITPSTWDEYKAHGPGTFNINPVSGAAGVYIGEQTLASMLSGGIEPIEWADLTSLVQTSALNPGAKYRITDYVTTVDQEGCRSAGNPFDLIVTAVDNHTLDEKATATLPSNNDNTYFDENEVPVAELSSYVYLKRVPLESWEIKYCLDNDKTRFAWADETNGKGVIWYMKDEFGNEAPYDFKNVQFKMYRIDTTLSLDFGNVEYAFEDQIDVDTEDEQWFFTFSGVDYSSYGFSEPYDFSWPHFVIRDEVKAQEPSLSGIGRLNQCSNNTIQQHIVDLYDQAYAGQMWLPRNVFQCALNQTVGQFPTGQCIGNHLDEECYENVFGKDASGNKLGVGCIKNLFGDNFQVNVLGQACCWNMIGHDSSFNVLQSHFSYNSADYYFSQNTCIIHCSGNSFGNSICNNTFGNYFSDNIIGNNCSDNTFGADCYSNRLGDRFNFNSFGNECCRNIFGDYCESNSLGNKCQSLTIGNSCRNNAFGNGCELISFSSQKIRQFLNETIQCNVGDIFCTGGTVYRNFWICTQATTVEYPDENFQRIEISDLPLKSYCSNIIVDAGNKRINLNCTATTSAGSQYKNVHVLQGVNNSTGESLADYKTITDSNVNQNFCTTYQPANSQVIVV